MLRIPARLKADGGKSRESARAPRPLRAPLRSAFFLGLALSAGSASGDGTITLKSVARVEAGRPVVLEDIAALEGPDAIALEKIVVLGDASQGLMPGARWIEVSIEQVRAAIETGDERAASRISLRGRSCAVMAKGAVAPALPVSEAPTPDQEVIHPAGTIGAEVERVLSSTVGAGRGDLRLWFDEAQRELLAGSTEGRWLDVRITGWSARTPVAITVFEEDRIVAEAVVRVGIEVRRSVLVATAPVSRGQTVEEDAFTLEERWLPVTIPAADPAEALGQELRCALRGGEVLEARQVTPPVVVRRGDRVVVSVVCGSVLIEEEARARRDARRGEVVDLESVDGEKRTIRARIDGPGRAMIATAESREEGE